MSHALDHASQVKISISLPRWASSSRVAKENANSKGEPLGSLAPLQVVHGLRQLPPLKTWESHSVTVSLQRVKQAAHGPQK